ncbi:MAG TPA: hypothetical protein VEP69_01495 [Thermodesulfovibrionales bacterium]|nr:hypothetical protein [Thermodesulfovibrionales bacterium]
MTYGEAIKTGFHTINSRLQLVGVQAVLMVINCVSFFIVVGIPLGIAFVIFGLDLTGVSNAKDIFSMFTSPSDFIGKYLWLVLMVVVFALLYFLMVTTLGLYVFSGSAGVVGRSVREPSLPFSMKQFFGEAGHFFFPMMWYAFLVSLLFFVIAFVLGIFGGGAAAVVTSAKSQDSTLALFLGIFFSLVLALVVVSAILVFLAITVYGIAVLYFKREGSWKAFRGAGAFLWKRPDAFWLYALVFVGYVCGSFFAMLISYPFHLIPIIGTIISFPLQLLSYMVQGYLGLVVLAIIFSYYHELEIKEKAPVAAVPDAGLPATGEGSTTPEDIFAPQAPGQAGIPPGTAETLED